MNAVTEQDAHNRLSRALRSLGECCYPPLGAALWPTDAQLHELDLAVVGLANMERKKPITVLTPYWKAYEWLNKREPQIRLVSRVKGLIERADQLLKEAGESDLVRLRRKASAGVTEARRLAEHLEAIQEDPSKAVKIEWEDYEGLLGDNKPFRLPHGDSASQDVRCYVRALHIIVEDLRYRRLLDAVFPFLTWIAGIGSPDAERLKHNYLAQYCADYTARRRGEAIVARRRDQWKKRQRRRRLKKLEASLRAKGVSEDEVQKILAANA